MTEFIAAVIWALTIIAWTIIRLPYRRKAKRREVIVDRKGIGERAALGFCIIGLVIVPALHLTVGPFEFADYRFQPILAWLGSGTMIAFLVVFHLSHKHLADNWSVSLEIRKDHELVQNGIYSMIRHPMYSSFYLWSIGQALLLPNWVAGFAGLTSVAWLYFTRIEAEEKMMLATFKEDYNAYCRRTFRLFPKLFQTSIPNKFDDE